MLTPVQQSQYGTPIFIIPKKEFTVRFIKDYRRLNQKLVRNPYSLPSLVNTMHKLERFQYVTALDINMGYYTIRISPASQYMTRIVTEFGKFRYNHLPMVMCSLGGIFQAKVDELIGYIGCLKSYIDGVLFLSKDSFKNHIDKLEIIFGRLRATGLKVDSPKFSLGLK